MDFKMQERIKNYIDIIDSMVVRGAIIEIEPNIYCNGKSYIVQNFEMSEIECLENSKYVMRYGINNIEVSPEEYLPIKKHLDKIYKKQSNI